MFQVCKTLEHNNTRSNNNKSLIDKKAPIHEYNATFCISEIMYFLAICVFS